MAEPDSSVAVYQLLQYVYNNPLHSTITMSRRAHWFMDSTSSHTVHKTITEFSSVVRFECRDSTSAPFPVHAMDGYELSFGRFQRGSILGPTAVLDVI